MKSAFITLSADSAYVLKTPKGAILKIGKNSFDVGKNTSVRLEIKEAYTAQDILLAGLSTESNGRLLRSGGMIYVNATANEEEIKLLKPINISIPGEVYDEKMQLFTGELKEDSAINWINPQPLDSSLIAKQLAQGKALFKANCANCHKTDKDFTGPALKGWRNRVPGGDWIYKYIANPAAMQQTDTYTQALHKKWRPALMTSFPMLGKSGVDAIMAYVDNEAALTTESINTKEIPEVPATTALETYSADTINPCITNDTIVKKRPGSLPSIEIITDTIPRSTITNLPERAKAKDMEGLRNGFTDEPISGMYQFSIETFGWYNVDAFVEGYDRTTNVNVNVSLQMEYEADMHLYLFCPEKKMLSVSNKNENNVYSFDKIDGKIPLFLNDKAILLAFGSKGDKTLYGTVSFTIQAEQSLTIIVKETTTAELRSFIKLNKIDGIKIDAAKKEMMYQQDVETKENIPVEFDIIQIPCNSYVDSTKVFLK